MQSPALECTKGVVCTVWDGSKVAKEKNVAWVAVLNISSQVDSSLSFGQLTAISHDELVEAQRADEAISEIIKLREVGTPLTDKVRKAASGATRRILQEYGKLVLENGLLYRRSNKRKQLVLLAKYKDFVLIRLHNQMFAQKKSLTLPERDSTGLLWPKRLRTTSPRNVHA